jgi:hypothetical protein
MSRKEATSSYREGQVWGYQTRHCDEQSYLIIVKVDAAPGPNDVVHISVEGVRIMDPHNGRLAVRTIGHIPISEEALSESVTEMLGVTTRFPDFHEGYEHWLSERNNSRAGYYTAPVAEIVEMIAQVMEGAAPISA